MPISPTKPVRAQDWLRQRIMTVGASLSYVNSMITEFSGPEDIRRTTISADIACDRYQFADGDALGLIQVALSMRLNQEGVERLTAARAWLLEYGNELKEQLAALDARGNSGMTGVA